MRVCSRIATAVRVLASARGSGSNALVASRFARGAFWSMAGTASLQAAKLVALIFAARLLGRTGFGELSLIQSAVGTFAVLAGLGLGLTAAKHVAELRTSDPPRAGRVIGLTLLVAAASGSLFALGLWLGAAHTAQRWMNAPHLEEALRAACGLLPLQAVACVQAAALAGLEAFKQLAVAYALQGLAFAVLVPTGVASAGVEGGVVALVAAAAASVAFNQLALRRASSQAGVGISYREAGPETAILWRFSLPALLSGAIVQPVYLATHLMLVQSMGYEQMGIFNAANQWRITLTFLPAVFGLPLLSVLSHLRAQGQFVEFRRLLGMSTGFMLVVSTLSGGALIAASPWILKAYGPAFAETQPVFAVLIAAAVAHATASVLGQSIPSSGRMWWSFGFNCLWALTLLLVAHNAIESHGALGLAWAVLASYAVHLVVTGSYASLLLWSDSRPAAAPPLRGPDPSPV